MFVAVSTVTWPGELWVEELSTVDLADMLGIPVHVQLSLHLLERLIEGVVGVKVVRVSQSWPWSYHQSS